jgi:hypothetical protein
MSAAVQAPLSSTVHPGVADGASDLPELSCGCDLDSVMERNAVSRLLTLGTEEKNKKCLYKRIDTK